MNRSPLVWILAGGLMAAGLLVAAVSLLTGDTFVGPTIGSLIVVGVGLPAMILAHSRGLRLTLGESVFAWIVVGVGSLYLVGQMVPRGDPEGKPALTKFGQILVLDGGRVKPLDSYARVNLMAINRRQVYTDENKTRRPAVQWVANALGMGVLRPSGEMSLDDDVAKYLGLPNNGGVYDLEDVRDAVGAKAQDLGAVRMMAPDKRTPTQRKALGAAMVANARAGIREAAREASKQTGDISRAPLFRIDNDQVLAMLGLEMREGLRYSQSEIINRDRRDKFDQFFRKAMAARERDEKSRDIVDTKSLELLTHLRTHTAMLDLEGVALVPGKTIDDFTTLSAALNSGDRSEDVDSLTKILGAYVTGDAKAFNAELDTFLARQAEAFPTEVRSARLEAWFNHFAPFYHSAILYAVVFVLAVLSWAMRRSALGAAGFRLCAVVVAVHTLALVLRMVIQQRPPVTNLYSSAVFIGWGCVLLGMWCEYLYKNGLGLAVASILGFATMVIAHHLGGSGDTLEMMQAVLDTNFWLSTHVTTVTLGYTATFVAGFLAIALVYGMLASTVRDAFLRAEPLTGGEFFRATVALAGVVGIPVLGFGGLVFGLWALIMEGETLPPLVGLTLTAPAAIAAVIIGGRIFLRLLDPKGDRTGVIDPIERLSLTADASKALTSLIYGVVCFATLLSFVGTVLGGIWADQSWGRFWGWDPKENGALLIVMMNALILHARWGGMIKERGLAMLAIAGNMVTAWSWFGTNQLGVGLHAYGFNNTLAVGCALFWLSQLVLIGLAAMPLRNYRLYAPGAEEREAATPPTPTSREGAKIAGRMARV